MSRRLILVPMLHTSADLGTLSESVKAHYVNRFGTTIWQERERLVEALWSDIREQIERLELDCNQVRLYQDGMPVCGHEVEIVKELAGAGSRNHQLLLELLDQGATLEGTEDPQLLIREYQMHQKQLATSEAAPGTGCASKREMDELLEARDRFIAERIAQTLQDGEIGLVFLGAAHRLPRLSTAGIQMATLAFSFPSSGLGTPFPEAPASRDAKQSFAHMGPQARAWEPGKEKG